MINLALYIYKQCHVTVEFRIYTYCTHGLLDYDLLDYDFHDCLLVAK